LNLMVFARVVPNVASTNSCRGSKMEARRKKERCPACCRRRAEQGACPCGGRGPGPSALHHMQVVGTRDLLCSIVAPGACPCWGVGSAFLLGAGETLARSTDTAAPILGPRDSFASLGRSGCGVDGCSLTSTARICRRSALCPRLLLRSACAAGE